MRYDVLTETDELKKWLLEYKMSSDEKIKNQLRSLITKACLPYVKKVAHGLARRNTDPVEDLVQVGSVGLLKAIDQYDAELGTSFKTYASYFITGEIRHYLRDKMAMIRAPRELQELSFRINQIIQELTQTLGQAPTDVEIAEKLSIPVEKLNDAFEIDRRKQILSLDQATTLTTGGDNEVSLMDKLVDNKYQEFINNKEDSIMLLESIGMLKEPLQEVIKMSFFHDMSQQEIANEIGVSQMQVSRRIKKALNELFEIITKKREVKD